MFAGFVEMSYFVEKTAERMGPATLVSGLGTLLEPSDALPWWFGPAGELAYKSLSYLTVCIANINLHINVADSA